MGDPSGRLLERESDADLGSICGFLDVQCMCGSRTSSFLWKYYCDVGDCAVSSWNFHPEAKKEQKKCFRYRRR